MEDTLKKGLHLLNISGNKDKVLDLLLSYINEIKMFNAVFNLVKVNDDKDLVISHILDSLAAWYFFDEEFAALSKNHSQKIFVGDAGSGAGFPGIPLASLFLLNRPEINFLLIERMTKRCAFLKNVKAVLNLTNTEILETEAEKTAKNYFDILTCRAFRPLDEHILQILLRCTKPGGKLFLYKATQEKLENEIKIIKKSNLKFTIKKLNCPFVKKERCLLIAEKPIDSILK